MSNFSGSVGIKKKNHNTPENWLEKLFGKVDMSTEKQCAIKNILCETDSI